MKVCPTCQSSFPDGFKYCPHDNSTLVAGEDFARSQAAPAAPAPVEAPVAEVLTVPEPKPVQQGYIAPREIAPEPPAAVPPPVPPKAETKEKKAPAPVQATVAPPVTAKAAAPAAAALDASAEDLRFALPDEGNIFSRLFGSLGNVKDVKFTLNPKDWLIARAFGQVGDAAKEFAADPKKFVNDLIRGEGENLKRRNALLVGSEMVTVGYMTMYLSVQALALLGKAKPMKFNVLCIAFVMYIVGCFAVRGLLLQKIIGRFNNKVTGPKLGLEFATWLPILAILLFAFKSNSWFCQIFPDRCFQLAAEEQQYKLIAANITTDTPKENKVAKKVPKEIEGKGGHIGGSKQNLDQAHGGGGQKNNAPVNKGTPPQMTQLPQVMPPTVRPPNVNNHSLIVAPTLVGDDKLSKAAPGRIGLPDGADAPPSMGNGSGTGMGSGTGGGRGPGNGGNMGGGNNANGGGAGDGGSGGIFTATASMKPTILYKEKAKYTEAARQNRVQGTVLVSAVFTADGRVTNINVVRGLPDGLNEEAIKAAQKIKFNPAMRNGQPVSVRMSIEFAFNLL